RRPAVRAGAGERGLARGAAGRRRAAVRAEHPRGRADHRAGRRGARAALDRSGAGAALTGARQDAPGRPRPGLAVAVGRYLDHLAVERGLAAHTLAAYRRDLARYQAAMSDRGRAEIGEVTVPDVAAYLARLRQAPHRRPPLAAGSRPRAMAAVRGLHAFAAAEGLASTDPASHLPPPTPAPPPPPPLPLAP